MSGPLCDECGSETRVRVIPCGLGNCPDGDHCSYARRVCAQCIDANEQADESERVSYKPGIGYV